MGLFDGITNYIGDSVATAGSLLGLPELGISESIKNEQAPVNGLTSGFTSNALAGDPAGSTMDPNYQAPTGGTVAGASTTALTPAQQLAAQQAAEKAAHDAALKAAFATQHKGILDSVGGAATTAGDQYGGSILDFLDQLKAGQTSIDNKGVQSELAKRQGMDGIMDMVGNGIRSGGVMLANKNASTSSAADALARAYSSLGQRQAAGVNNQFGQEQIGIDDEQTQLNAKVGTQRRHNDENKKGMVDSIVNDAVSKLSALDAQIAGASLPDRIAIEQEKSAIYNQAMAAVQGHDAQFDQGVAGINPLDRNGRMVKANELATAGVGAENPFQLTSEAPAQFQGTGGFESNLPLFQLPRNKRLA